MANILIQSPFEYLTDRNGRALANGKIYIGEPNKDPESFPVAAFFDVAGTVPAPQPIRTNSAGFPCDMSGNPQRIYTAANYSIRVSDQNDAQVVYAANSADGFYGVIASDLANQTDPDLGSGMVGWVYASGASGDTLHDKVKRGWVDVKDFGAIGDGLANDKASFDAAASTGRTILLTSGTYNVPSGDYSSVRFYSFDGATTNNGTIAIVDPLASSLPVGVESFFSCAESSLPFGWLPLNGSIVNRLVYPQLWAYAEGSGNIVDEAGKAANPAAFGRGDGTSTFSLPNKRGSLPSYQDSGSSVDTSLVLGKRITKDSQSGAGATFKTTVGTMAIRAFAQAVNEGSTDITALQAQVNAIQSSIFGYMQDWVDVTGSRSAGTTYTNSTSRPIMVCVTVRSTGGGTSAANLVVGGVSTSEHYTTGLGGATVSTDLTAVIRPGVTYTVSGLSGATLVKWAEFR